MVFEFIKITFVWLQKLSIIKKSVNKKPLEET